MAYDKTTVTADAPASSDNEILARIRALATQPREPLAPMTPVRDPLMLAIAGGFNPGFRANVVDPIIAERQARPQLEQAYADEGQQQEIRNLTGLQEMETRQGYLDMARDDRARAGMEKDAAITGNIQQLEVIGQQFKPRAESAKRVADIIGQRPEPFFKGMSQRIQGTLQEIEGIFQALVANPTMEPDAADEMLDLLEERMTDVDEAIDYAMKREEQLRQFDAENQANKAQAELESGLRVGEEQAKAGLKGGSNGRPIPAASAMNIGELQAGIDAARSALTTFASLGKPAGMLEGSIPTDRQVKMKAELQRVQAPIRKALIGVAQSPGEMQKTMAVFGDLDAWVNAEKKVEAGLQAILDMLEGQKKNATLSLGQAGFDTSGFGAEQTDAGLPEGAVELPARTKAGKRMWKLPDGTILTEE